MCVLGGCGGVEKSGLTSMPPIREDLEDLETLETQTFFFLKKLLSLQTGSIVKIKSKDSKMHSSPAFVNIIL